MPFDWSEYLSLADELSKRTDEGSLRSAISRAYYYVYHIALRRAEPNGFQPLPGEGIHAQLWRCFRASPEATCSKLGVIGERLKDRRVKADYDPNYLRITEDVQDVLTDARDFDRRLKALPSRFPNPSSARRWT